MKMRMHFCRKTDEGQCIISNIGTLIRHASRDTFPQGKVLVRHTPSYLSPEIISLNRRRDCRRDLGKPHAAHKLHARAAAIGIHIKIHTAVILRSQAVKIL